VRIRVLGGGFYGCHIALALLRDGHDVELHEIADRLFAGASGGIPARLHDGWHYPRSMATRQACQQHREAFMSRYGFLTRAVPVNIYAIAADDSLVDFGTYLQVLSHLQCIVIEHPAEFGLKRVEGAVLTGERHILTDNARDHFAAELGARVRYNVPRGEVNSPEWDYTIDCTFCANESAGVDRYEPCVTALLEGPTDRAVTIMDGPFPSLYPWNERQGLSSLTSAKYTPFARCKTREEAEQILESVTIEAAAERCSLMMDQIATFYPAVRDTHRVVDHRLSIRALPRSGADARLVEVMRVGDRALRVRAGKIDAIIHAEAVVREMLRSRPERTIH
jgi:hypothetical protein